MGNLNALRGTWVPLKTEQGKATKTLEIVDITEDGWAHAPGGIKISVSELQKKYQKSDMFAGLDLPLTPDMIAVDFVKEDASQQEITENSRYSVVSVANTADPFKVLPTHEQQSAQHVAVQVEQKTETPESKLLDTLRLLYDGEPEKQPFSIDVPIPIPVAVLQPLFSTGKFDRKLFIKEMIADSSEDVLDAIAEILCDRLSKKTKIQTTSMS